jgi:hypothetical protein
MNSNTINITGLEQGFQKIAQSSHWRNLSKMPGVTETFNVFQVLDDAVCENSWSRILAVLFTSSGGHGLDLHPLKTWLSMVAGNRFKVLANQAVASSALCEWGNNGAKKIGHSD